MASTKNHSQLNLAKEKRKLFTAFLAMLGLLFSAFAVISGAFYSARYDENNEGTKKIITNVIEANKTDLAMELFVKQTAAFDLRLQNLRDKLKSMIQDPDLCLVDIQGVLVAQTYPGCSSLINNSGNAIVHPIIEAESKVGTIYVNYRNPFDLSSFLTDYKWYIATICAGFLIALLALIGFFKKYMGRVFERVTEFERHASMGQTAHMLAHDIQTPLNVLQHGLNIIADSSDTDKIKRVAATTLPAVEKAKLQIQNMLADLHERNVQSVFVEGGSFLLNSLLTLGLWDEARVFESPVMFEEGISAPSLNESPLEEIHLKTDVLKIYRR